MDEMKLTLKTKFMRNLVSKLISKFLYKHYKIKTDIRFDNIDINSVGGETTVKVTVEGKLHSEDFYKIMDLISSSS